MISSILLSTLVTAYGGGSDCYRTVCYFCQAKSGGGCTYDHYACEQSDQCLREGEVCTANYDCSTHCASCDGYSTSYASGDSNNYDSSKYASVGSNNYASSSSNNYASSSSNNYGSGGDSKKYSGGDSKRYSSGGSKKYSSGGSKKYSGGGSKKYSGGGKTYTGDDEGSLLWWHILLIALGVLLLLGVLGYLYFIFFGKKKDFDEEAKSQPSHLDFDASTSRALSKNVRTSRNLLSPSRNLAPPKSPTYKSRSPTSKSPTNKGKSPAKNKFGWVAE